MAFVLSFFKPLLSRNFQGHALPKTTPWMKLELLTQESIQELCLHLHNRDLARECRTFVQRQKQQTGFPLEQLGLGW